MTPDLRTDIAKIQQAFEDATFSAGSPAAAEAARRARDAALAPYMKEANDNFDGEQFRRRTAGLSAEAAALADVNRRYDELMKLHAGAPAVMERDEQARREATAAIVEQYDRTEMARQANHAVEIQAIGARTDAEPIDVGAERRRIAALAEETRP